jgi:wyosine [tRNA(Phe)-imidazoG37] synthetase (radical SAM superfamily)
MHPPEPMSFINSSGAILPAIPQPATGETAFGCPRDFLGNRFVYTVISPRARGLSVGLNLNPDRFCNFDCIYCEISRDNGSGPKEIDLEVMSNELSQTLEAIHSRRLFEQPRYCSLPEELLQLRHVALSGDGEPTLSPRFDEVLQMVLHLRALGQFPFFKLVLITNCSGLDLPPVQEGLKCLTASDEIWAKLEVGTQPYMERINRPSVSLEKILSNILLVSRRRPVVIQSLFPLLNGQEPPPEEINHYVQRLRELKAAGARISLVQIYSATRPTLHPECGHLPLKSLSRIAQQVREITGLRAEVF